MNEVMKTLWKSVRRPQSSATSTGVFLGKPLLWKIVLCVLSLLVAYKVVFWTWDEYILRRLEASWHGFEQTGKGCYNFTVVTGLFDIGRGKWWTQGRTYNQYLGYLLQILMLDVNLVVFIEPKGADFVGRMRKGRESRTLIVPTELSDLEYYPLLPKIRAIMSNESFQEGNVNYQRGLPEGTDPLYNLVTNSKTTLVHLAVARNPFRTSHFVWMDGGYGHGEAALFPADGVWCPHHLLQYPKQVTFTAFESLTKDKMEEARMLYKQKTAWIAGGLFSGGAASMERFYHLHRDMIRHYIRNGVFDDDQTTFVDCVLRDPDNFRPVTGDWYDLLKLKPFHR